MSRLSTVIAILTTAFPIAAQAPLSPPLTTVTTLPLGEHGFTGGFVGSPGGNLVYYTTPAGVMVFDRTAKTTNVAVKGEFVDLATSVGGDRLIMTRMGEGEKAAPKAPRFIWTVAVSPRTGVAIGEPRRISTIPAESPALSPDGRWIAFIASGNPRKMMVMPSDGGSERVLFERGGPRSPVQWSSDGKWIYFSQPAGNGKAETAVSRVSFDGGTPVRVAIVGDFGMVAPDGKHILGLDGNSKGLTTAVFTLEGAAADSGRSIDLLDGVPCALGFAGSSGVGMRMLMAVVRPNLSWHYASVPSGVEQPGRVVTAGMTMTSPAISPDGKHLAAAVDGDTVQWAFATMNADGSGQHIVRAIQSWDLDAYTWSPDGRYVAFTGDKRLTLYVDEVSTGKVTKVGSAELHLTDYRWLPDSRTLLYTRQDGTPKAARVSIHEASVGGQDRLVRDITSELPRQDENWSGTTWLLGDSAALVIRAGLVFPLRGGAPHRAYDAIKVSTSDDGSLPAASYDGRWIAIPGSDRKTLDVVESNGAGRHTLHVPGAAAISKPLAFLPDDRAVIAAVDSSATTGAAIYVIPVDGSAPRALVTLGAGETIRNLSLSPDGKSILYQRMGPVSLSLIEADLGAGLKPTSTKKPE